MSELKNGDSKGANGRRNIHILHVDDDPCILEVSKSILELEGNFEVDSVLSVDDALKKLVEQAYDMVVSDYEMPNKNGLDFLRTLREQKNMIPFALFTGKGREDVAMTALNLGADGYYNKQGSTETVYGELAHGIKQSVVRKKSVLALASSEEKFKVYIENSPVAIFVANPQGKYEYVNNVACKLLGYSKEELLEMSIPQIIFKQTNHIDLKKFEEVKETGQSLSETALKTKEGLPVYVILNSAKLPDGKLIAFCENITERKQAEENLQETKALLADAEKTGKIGGFEFDVDTLTQTWTEETFRILEIDPLIGEPIVPKGVEFVNPPYRSMANVAIQHAIEHAEPYDQEWEITTTKGNKRWVHTVGKPNYENGKVKTISGSFQDITQRKQVELQLADSELCFRELFSKMPSGVVVYEVVGEGEDFVIKDFNKAAEKIEGVSCKDVVGKRVSDVFLGVKDFGLFEVFQRVYRTGVCEYYPNAIYKDNGDLGSWRENWVYKLPNKNIVAIYNDITQRKQVEDELRDSETKLRSIVVNSSDKIFMLDENFKYLTGNKALADLLGKYPKDIIGKSISELYDAETADRFLSNIKSVFGSCKGSFVEEKMAIQGHEFYVSTSLNPVQDDTGKETVSKLPTGRIRGHKV